MNRVEHISLHPQARPGPVIGVYVHARDLATAESVAEQAWQRATALDPTLLEWRLVSAEVPLMRPDLDL
ncbi:hypothetical protein [Streptomyces sp. NPDC101166]|uniref:hypothetical protein n=1 Tax=Streptomyces sp. NPDC101166 TaxID=3366120 RepID=UPI00380D9FF6